MAPSLRRRPGAGRPRAAWRRACAALVIAVTASLIAAPAAHAEVIHPRQQWLRDSAAGLFKIHNDGEAAPDLDRLSLG